MDNSIVIQFTNRYKIICLHLILLGAFMQFSACEKNVEMNISNTKRKITVNSFFQNDSIIKINLSKSFFVTEEVSQFPYIINADVNIYEGDNFIETLKHYGNGNYLSTFIPVEGKNYKIEVNHDTYSSALASSYVPYKVASTLIDSTIDYNGNCQLSIKFTDPANVPNYYWIYVVEVKEFYQIGDTIPTIFYYPIYFNTYDSILEEYNNMNEYGYIFSDKMINGNEHIISLDCRIDFYSTKVQISFRHISEELYLYLDSYNKKYGFVYNYSNAVEIYNNINNGYGIFAGYNSTVFTINN